MPESADVVVIGGGIFGCATAWSLARCGAGRVVVLERRELAAATTSRAAALLTRVCTEPGQTALATETHAAIDLLEDELGEGLGLRRCGSLHVAASDASRAALLELAREAEARDEPLEWIGAADAEERVPWLLADGAQRIALMPADGFVDPYRLATAYADAAKRRGVVIRTGVAATGLLRDRRRVCGVETPAGELAAGCVIDAAGPWAGLLAAEAGWHLPMAPVRSHYWITAPEPVFAGDQPYVVLPDACAYARPEVGGLLFGLRDPASPSCDPRELPDDLSRLRFDGEPNGWDVLAESGPALARFFPGLFDVQIAHYVAAPSTYTPDRQHVIGPVPGVDGFLVAAGCCGNGIAASGGVGRAVAELAIDGTTAFDLEPFRADRFGAVYAFSAEWRARCAAARSSKRSG